MKLHHLTRPLLIASLVLSTAAIAADDQPSLSGEPTAELASGLSDYFSTLGDIGPLYLEVGYIYHDLDREAVGHASLRAWEDGDRYRYEVDVDDSLTSMGQMGSVQYAYDGVLAMMKWPGTRQLIVARHPHSHLPLPVPHPLAVLFDFASESPSMIQRFRVDDAAERWQQITSGSTDGALTATDEGFEIKAEDGTTSVRVELTDIGGVAVPRTVDKVLQGQRLRAVASDWEMESLTDDLPIPRQIDLDVWNDDQKLIGRGVLRLTRVDAKSLDRTDFRLIADPRHPIWVDEEEAMYDDVDATLARLRGH